MSARTFTIPSWRGGRPMDRRSSPWSWAAQTIPPATTTCGLSWQHCRATFQNWPSRPRRPRTAEQEAACSPGLGAISISPQKRRTQGSDTSPLRVRSGLFAEGVCLYPGQGIYDKPYRSDHKYRRSDAEQFILMTNINSIGAFFKASAKDIFMNYCCKYSRNSRNCLRFVRHYLSGRHILRVRSFAALRRL